MKWLRPLIIATAALAATVTTASADVIYTFTQTGPLNSRSFNFSARLVLTDEAENGFDLNLRVNPSDGSPTSYTATNVLDFSVAFSSIIQAPLTWDIADLLAMDAPGRSNAARHGISLSGDGAGVNGLLGLDDMSNTLRLTVEGLSFSGWFASDDGYRFGCQMAPCQIAGVIEKTIVTATDVPEPASLAMFGVGLAGLGLVRRRRGNT
jgi:hypothetical protein